MLIWSLKCLLSMLRCMLAGVKGEKSENPKGEGEIRKWKREDISAIYHIITSYMSVYCQKIGIVMQKRCFYIPCCIS